MKNFKKLIKEAHLGNPLNEDKLPDGFHSKEDLDQFLKDNPFDSERYKKLSIAQKQDILSYLNRDTEKEFERRMSMREEKKQLPKEIANHKDIPSWARYVAQHSDGEWTWYEETPTIVRFKSGGGAWKQDGNQTYTGVKTDGKDWDKIPTYYYVKDDEIKAVEEGTCGYGEDGKVDPENTDKLKPAGPINEIESGDVVVYNGKDHTVQGIKNFNQDTMVSIRPNERSYYGGRKDTFWVKPEDLESKEDFLDRMMRDQIQHDEETLSREIGEDMNEMLMQALPVEKLTDKALVNLLNNLDDDTGKFTNAKSELMKAAGDEVKRRGLKVHYVDNDRYEFMNEDMNDPVLVKARAAKMADEKEKAKQAELDKKYGKSFMDKLEAEIDLKNELQNLEKEREDVLMRIEDIGFETEQTAEPEGGKIADKLGRRLMAAEKELRALDNKIIDVKDELGYFRMYESVNESKYRVGYEDEEDIMQYFITKVKSKDEAEVEATKKPKFKRIKSIELVDEPSEYVLEKPGKGYVRKMTINDYVKDIKDAIKFKNLKSAEQGAEYFNRFHRIDDVVVQAINESDLEEGNGGAKQDFTLNINNPGAESRALDDEVNKMGYSESLQESLRKKLQDRLK